MGILGIIQGAKTKFKNKASKEEVEDYRKTLVKGDIEVYDKDKKTIGGMIQSAKSKFRSTKAKLEMMQDERREHQNAKMKKQIENIKLKNKLAKEKEALQKKTGKGLRAMLGQVNVPTAQKGRFGGEPFQGSSSGNNSGERKNVVNDQTSDERNALGGKDPFS